MYCDDPQAVVQLLQEAKNKNAAAAAPVMVAATPVPMEIARDDSPLDEVKKLKELLDDGAISQAEFEEKKAILMSRI